MQLHNLLLDIAEWLGRQLHRIENNLEGRDSAQEPRPGLPQPGSRIEVVPPIRLPDEIVSILTDFAEIRHGSLANVTVVDGINEIVFYLDRATQWHIRRKSQESDHACKLANVMRAYWLLQTIRQAAGEYQAAINQTAFDDFRQDLDSYGMTLPRFLSQLEEVWDSWATVVERSLTREQKILHVHKELLREQPQHPTVSELQSVLSRERNSWLEHGQLRPQQDDRNTRRGKLLMKRSVFRCSLGVWPTDLCAAGCRLGEAPKKSIWRFIRPTRVA